jgi:hypothetical protein
MSVISPGFLPVDQESDGKLIFKGAIPLAGRSSFKAMIMSCNSNPSDGRAMVIFCSV